MLPRFYAPELDVSAPTASLPDDERHHLTRVLRLERGQRALLFDGRGAQVLAEVDVVEKSDVRLRLLEPVPAAPELDVDITVAQAVLKGDKMDAVVRDVTMMGASAIRPVMAARTIVPARALDRERSTAIARWHRVAVSSAKQCGRAVVPRIDPAVGVDEVLRPPSEACRLMLTEPAVATKDGPNGPPDVPPASAVLLIGPEGGWTEAEIEAARDRGWRSWSLGPTTIRADAAALVALGALAYAWDRRRR
jgi:16S rRNA (uracil1498-N3)-methyltransferase